MFRVRAAEPPEDVKDLFKRYSENGTMSLEQLLLFLRESQGQKNATKEEAQAILHSLKQLNIFQRKGLHLEAFFRFLLGDLNFPLSPSLGVSALFLLGQFVFCVLFISNLYNPIAVFGWRDVVRNDEKSN